MPRKKYAAIIQAYREVDGVGIHVKIDAPNQQDLEALVWELAQSIQKHHPEVIKGLGTRLLKRYAAKTLTGIISTALEEKTKR